MARQLLATYLTITALTLAVVVVPLGRVFADREQSRLTYLIERDAQAVGSLVEDNLEDGTAPSIDATLSDYRSTGGRIVVVDTNGLSVADSDSINGATRDFSTRPEIVAALDGQRSTGTRASETLGTSLLYVAVPVASGGTVHGAVRITYPTSALDARIRDTWLRLGFLSAVVLALVAAVGVIFASGVTRPIRRLQRASTRLAAGDLTVRVEARDGPPELRVLAETFNTTTAQLAALIESQHRFVADASHQLRTPLTALRLRLETLGPHVAEAARPKLDAAIAETNRLGRLVHSLLVLARSDAAPTEAIPVDLTAAITERVDAWAPVGEDQSVRLRGHCPPGVWVLALPGAIEQILDNLISNALDAVAEETEILIRADPADDTVDVHVIDQGPGMDPEWRQHAFERFWRRTIIHPDGDHERESTDERTGEGTDESTDERKRTGESNSSDRGGTGFGLGLAIVAQLATRSGGRARLDAGPDGVGLDAVITLRRTTSPGNGARGDQAGPRSNLYPALTSG